MAKNIWVFCEQRDGVLQSVALELLGVARELAAVTGEKVGALLVGSNVSDRAQELIAYGADEVHRVDDVRLANYMTEPYAQAVYQLVKAGELQTALELQNDCCRIIYKMCSGHGNMYGMIKEILRINGGPDCGSVRLPLAALVESDLAIAQEAAAMIRAAVAKYC